MVEFVIFAHAPIRQCFESIRSTQASVLLNIADMDIGTHQLLEQLLNLESDVDQTYSGMTDGSADLQSPVYTSVIENQSKWLHLAGKGHQMSQTKLCKP